MVEIVDFHQSLSLAGVGGRGRSRAVVLSAGVQSTRGSSDCIGT